MASNEAKNEVQTMVLSDLAAICQKLAENSAVPEMLRERADELFKEFNLLVPYRGKCDAEVHFRAERLLTKMARFLPRILELETWPEDASHFDEALP